MEYILKTNCLEKRYHDFTALNGLTMSVPKGSIYGFVGKNGAGKTTLIRLICGLQHADGGDFELYGEKNTSRAIFAARRRMGAVIETPSIYLDMTAEDNLKQQYDVLGVPAYEGMDDLLKLVGLSDTGKKKAKNFSLGMRQRLGIAVALCGDPDFLVLDEPINGLDPQGIKEVREILVRMRDERGIAILISSHILEELDKVADCYGVINEGTLLDEFSAQQLHLRSGKYVKIRTENPEAALEVLGRMNIQAQRMEERDCIRVSGHIDQTSEMAKALVNAGVDLKEIFLRNVSLEDYYLNMTKGGHHD